ncbi:hypothetical protein BC832DRAFT_566225 [Gaertneriomyces semiglobifer]|nr:hypothetical protein BC832DRAFT_566225 [Gaertneriomyces semiglobifer]
MMSIEDDDVPPLEDLSEVIAQKLKPTQPTHPVPNKQSSTKTSSILLELEESRNQRKSEPARAAAVSSFGLKKGFLNSSNGSSSKSNSSAQPKKARMTELTAKPKNSLELPEVQDEMRKTMDKLPQKEWLTPELLEKVASSPILSKAFADPAFMSATQMLAKNPAQAFEALQRTHPQYITALRELASLLADQFNGLAESHQQQNVEKLIENNGLDTQEKAFVQKVMSNPKAVEALKDPRVLQALGRMQKDKKEVGMDMIRGLDEDLRSKVGVLIELGVLGVSPAGFSR